jgi:hypothetical protein
MDTVFLLRSYGDFVIALASLEKSSGDNPIAIRASRHFYSLFQALQQQQLIGDYPDITFIDLDIRRQILGAFTNKYLFYPHSFRELQHLKNHLRQYPVAGKAYLEQKLRHQWLSWFTGQHFQYIHDGRENIYTAYSRFTGVAPVQPARSIATDTIIRVLITPGSRKPGKALPAVLVNALRCDWEKQGVQVKVAGLPTELSAYDGKLDTYSSFVELLAFIKEADMVLSADSLPVHLAALMGKPHHIYYNGKVNHPWLTPYAGLHNTYTTF